MSYFNENDINDMDEIEFTKKFPDLTEEDLQNVKKAVEGISPDITTYTGTPRDLTLSSHDTFKTTGEVRLPQNSPSVTSTKALKRFGKLSKVLESI